MRPRDAGHQIEFLREAGFEVNVRHERPWNGELRSRYEMLEACQRALEAAWFPATPPADMKPRVAFEPGGRTVVELRDPDGREFRGVARCNPREQFNRRLGLAIALGRACEAAEVNTRWLGPGARSQVSGVREVRDA